MASPTDTKPKTQADYAEAPDSDAPLKPRYDEKIEGNSFDVLRRNLDVTLPPNERLRLLSAPVPIVPPEELQDTVPPNAGITAPTQSTARAPASARGPSKASPVEFSGSRDDSAALGTRRKQRLRAIVIGAVVVAALFAMIGLWLHQSSPDAATGQLEPQQTAPTDTSAAAPLARAATVTPTVSPPEVQPTRATPPASGPPRETSARPEQVSPQPKQLPIVPPGPKSSTNHAGSKPPASPVAPSKPAPASGTTSDSGSAFDGLMRPPSD